MDMDLNFTLIVQMVHFLIAYILLKRFLFGPLVALVCKEDAIMADLEQAVQARRALVVQQQEHLHEQWQVDRAYFAQIMPRMQDLESKIVHTKEYHIQSASVSDDDLAQLQEEVNEQLIKKVRRVH